MSLLVYILALMDLSLVFYSKNYHLQIPEMKCTFAYKLHTHGHTKALMSFALLVVAVTQVDLEQVHCM